MTLITARMFSAYNGLVYFEVVWDSPMIDENEVPQDPTATWLVSALKYQNLTSRAYYMKLSNRTYIAEANTPATTINIPAGQQFRLDEAPTATFGEL